MVSAVAVVVVVVVVVVLMTAEVSVHRDSVDWKQDKGVHAPPPPPPSPSWTCGVCAAAVSLVS